MSLNSKKNKKAVCPHGADRLSATLRFDASVEIVDQVSVKRAEAFEARGIERVRDLLNQFPRHYLDMSQIVTIDKAPIGFSCTIVGTVFEITLKHPRGRRNLSILEITVLDQTGTLIVTCFNQPWLANKISKGSLISVSGTVEFNYGFKRMTNPFISEVEEEGDARGFIQATHSSIASLSPSIIKRMIASSLNLVAGMYDPIPFALRKKYRLCSRFEAYRAFHLPNSMEEVSIAHRRLLYEELLFLELQLIGENKSRSQDGAFYIEDCSAELLAQIDGVIPFKLTDEQKTAVAQIIEDMTAPISMDRLLLGDVGTGKTIVSLYPLAIAAKNGHQAAMVGPTEILVKQYERSLGTLLDMLGISWATLTGTTSKEEREEILTGLSNGSVSICFGTHALFEPDVQFASCAFICIDEQQRFGVEQREALLAKSPSADVLSMTATPIPRSLALALYGTTALSYLRTAPQLKSVRTTKVLPFSEEGVAYDAVRAALARGEQAYVVCPLIGIPTEELDQNEMQQTEQVEYALVEFALESDSYSESMKGVDQAMIPARSKTLSAAEKHAEILQNQIFPDAKVALLHGRLSAQDKTKVMQDFLDGKIDILVSTTIVEVGVDVPNATVMIIEDADRFGLAQLHQLRGRVGRGEKPGEIFLVTRSKAPLALERLSALEVTEDGFELSEIDLSQRKEGDIFGARQHGRSPLRLVNVIRDSAVIEAAHADAHAILEGSIATEDERAILEQELRMIAHS